jgi:hypothetical protein
LELGNGLLHSSNHKNQNREEEENGPHSKSIYITRTANTGIIYLPLPEPRLLLVKPQHSFDFKHQIEQDFYIRYRYLNNDELNEILYHQKENDINRYKSK